MLKKQDAFMLALMVAAGFAGGMASNAIFTTQPLHAQGGMPKPVIPAQPFSAPPNPGIAAPGSVTTAEPASTTIAVPEGGVFFKRADGRVVARLYADNDGGHFEIRNNQGVVTAKLNGGGSLETYDRQGHLKSQMRSDAASFISYNGGGQAAVTIGSGNIPGSGYLIVNRFGDSRFEIAVRYGGQTREDIWHSP